MEKNYLPKTTNQAWNRYLDFLIDTRFLGVNRFFVLSFKDDDSLEGHKQYYLSTEEIKDYVMIDGRNSFHQPIKCFKNMITLKRLQQVKVMITQQDVY